jgi:hypothetical protein
MALGVTPDPTERSMTLAGDELVPAPDVVMDRAFSLAADREAVWPWFAQLGKGRAGWYLPRWIEAMIPRRRRAFRHLDATLQQLRPGDVIDDWGGRDATFEIVRHDPPAAIVHRSRRSAIRLSWTIVLRAEPRPDRVDPEGTRVHLRLRLAGLRRPWLARTGGELLDLLTVAGLAAGLRERLRQSSP